MYCKKCGKPVADNQEICDECKSKLQDENVLETKAEETSKESAVTNETSTNTDNSTAENYSKETNAQNFNNNQYNAQGQFNQGQYNNQYNQSQFNGNPNMNQNQYNYQYNQSQFNGNPNMNQNQYNYNQGPYTNNQGNQNQYNQNPYYSTYAPDAKSKIAAGLLGILLGAFGIHNFYLGYIGKAVAQLLITLLSLGILSWISAIWGLIEGVMILVGSINVDGYGKPLKD